MANKVKRTFALLLAIIMLLLCGCGKHGESNPNGKASSPKGTLAAEFKNVHYKGDYKIKDTGYAINTSCFANGRLYYNLYDDEAWGKEIRSCLPDGSDDRPLENFTLTEEEYFAPRVLDKSGVYRIYPGKECLYVVECTESHDPKFFDLSQQYFLHKIDYSGNKISSVEFEGDKKEILRQGILAFDDNENMYYTDWTELFVYSPDGAQLFHASDNFGYIKFLNVEGKSPIVVRNSASGGVDILSVNLEKQCFEELMRNVNATSLYDGAEGFDFTFVDGTALYGADIDTGEIVPLFLLANCGIFNETLECVLPYEGGLVCVESDYEMDNKSWGVTLLKRYEGGYSDDKTVLTLASGYGEISSVIYRSVIKFNQMSTDYRVEIKDYSLYDTSDSFAGSSLLNTEILAGKTPDMFITDTVDYDVFASRGILEDLLPYIDADKSLGGREALVWPVFESMLYRDTDKLYKIVPGFAISTVVGDKRIIGEKDFDIENIKKVFEKMPEGCTMFQKNYARQFALYSGMGTCAGDYIDWENGKCSFDSPDFIALLEFINDYFPKDWDVSSFQLYYDDFYDMAEGESLFVRVDISDFEYISFIEDVLEDNAVFVGWPGSKTARSDFSVSSGIAMCSASEHKDAAWEFMRLMLTEETQLSKKTGLQCFPTNRNAFEAKLKNATISPDELIFTEEESGEEEGAAKPKEKPTMMVVNYTDGKRIIIPKLTEEQVDAFWKLIESPAANDSVFDEEFWSIIQDEAEGFFSGRITAEEAAKAIQRRAEIYISERK